jgi:hypothetical protein
MYSHTTPSHSGQRAGQLVQFTPFWLSHVCDAALPTFKHPLAHLSACLIWCLPDLAGACRIWLCQDAISATVLGRYEHWLAIEPTVASALEGNITGQDMVGDVLSHLFLRHLNCSPCCCSQARQPTVSWSPATCELPPSFWLSHLDKAKLKNWRWLERHGSIPRCSNGTVLNDAGPAQKGRSLA